MRMLADHANEPENERKLLCIKKNSHQSLFISLSAIRKMWHTWITMAAFVCLLNLNSLRAIMPLKPVCNTIAADLLVTKDFLAMYRRKFFWNLRAAASIISFLCTVRAISPAIRKKIFNTFKLPATTTNRKREEMSKQKTSSWSRRKDKQMEMKRGNEKLTVKPYSCEWTA